MYRPLVSTPLGPVPNWIPIDYSTVFLADGCYVSHRSLAGTETTSVTLAYCLYALSTCPGVMSKLQAELDEAIPDPEAVISISVAQNLPYLNAVVKEGEHEHDRHPLFHQTYCEDVVG